MKNLTHEITDKAILLLVCQCLYVLQSIYDITVIPLIVVVILGCLFIYIDNIKIILVLRFTYVLLCFFIPELVLFSPIIAYDTLAYKYTFTSTALLIPIILVYDFAGLPMFFMILSLNIAAICLQYRTNSYHKMYIKFNELYDDTTSLSQKLKSQNKALIEKQDDEIHLATLKERNRIAREIHDNVGHQLSRVILQIGALLAVHKDEKLREPLIDINNTLSQAMTSIRESVHELHDQSIDLHMQTEELLNDFTFCDVTFDDQIINQPSRKIKIAVISIVKEALSNIAKHSNAKKAYILYKEHPAFYQFIIRDDGSINSSSNEDGIGLINMTDRVASLNGNIRFRKDNGFEIFITIPKENN